MLDNGISSTKLYSSTPHYYYMMKGYCIIQKHCITQLLLFLTNTHNRDPLSWHGTNSIELLSDYSESSSEDPNDISLYTTIKHNISADHVLLWLKSTDHHTRGACEDECPILVKGICEAPIPLSNIMACISNSHHQCIWCMIVHPGLNLYGSWAKSPLKLGHTEVIIFHSCVYMP